MLGVSGTTQYINPDYIQPLPTSLDTKNSPLALLAQTCSSIGKDNSPSSAPSSSSSSSSSLLSSSSSSSSSKLNQHQQIHSSSSSSSSLDKKESKNLLNGKDQSSRMKSSDSSLEHNGGHHHHAHHHHSSGYSHNSYKMSSASGKSGYNDRLSKENGRSSAGRLSASPPKHKLSSSNGYGMNGNKNHLSKSDAGASYRSAMQSYYGNGKEDYISSLHHHQPSSSKLSPSSAASPLQSLKMQQELFNAAFGMGYPPWLMGQSPFMPPTFDPFFLSAAALSSQHKQHLLQLHQQLFSSLSGYPSSETGGSSGSLGSGGPASGSSHKHDTDAGVSPTSKSSSSSHSSSTGQNSLHSNSSSLFPLPAYAASHIPGHSSSQGHQSPSSHPYACNWLQPGSDFCGKRFSTYEELLEHLKSHVAQGSGSEDGRLFPHSFFPFMFGMAPPFALPSGYNSNYLLQQQQQQQQQQAAAASLFQRSYSPSPPSSSSSSSSLSSTSTHLSSRYHPYNKPPTSSGSASLSSPSIFPSLMPFPTPTSSNVASQFSSLMPPFGYGFPYPMYGGQKLNETAAGP